MKSKLGICLILVGAVLLAGAAGLYLNNDQQQRQAAQASQQILPMLVDAICQRQETTEPSTLPPSEQTLPVVELDGHSYLGFIGIPSLELELPVMADWSYPQLRLSPCRFTGELCSDDLVIMAHNYAGHFGSLHTLRTGDTVTFTDMDGNISRFAVMATDILEATAVEEMTSGAYDLTLFTCTYGGESRITVRCDRIPE